MTTDFPVTLAGIEAAARAIAGAVEVTPARHSRTLSAIAGTEIFLKFENLQFTASFKERGALNKLLSLSDEEKQTRRGRDVGGQSRAGRRLSRAPARDSRHHRDAGRHALHQGQAHPHFGAHVVFDGATAYRDPTRGRARSPRNRGLTPVHPYDDPAVIAGQGTSRWKCWRVPELDRWWCRLAAAGLIRALPSPPRRPIPRSASMACRARSIRRCRRRQERERPCARTDDRRRHRGQGAGTTRKTSSARLSTTSCLVENRDRERHRDASGNREDACGRGGRRRPCRHPRRARFLQGAQASAS